MESVLNSSAALAAGMALVEVCDATFGYGRRPVVWAEALCMRRGQCLGMFGPNGVGKSTLVRGLAGLLFPQSGRVIRHAVADGAAGSRPVRFGYLPQHRSLDLNWPMSGFDAAAMAISSCRGLGWIGPVQRRRIGELLRKLEVDSLARMPFARLSGGQQQRLLLAGAMAAEPDVLVLDEPTDGLDVKSRQTLLEVLRSGAASGLATVMISHDVEDLLFFADRIAWLHVGAELDAPSTVELITPAALAQRVTHARQAT